MFASARTGRADGVLNTVKALTGGVSKVADTVSDAELNIPDFPEKYKEVTSLKAKQELWKKFFG